MTWKEIKERYPHQYVGLINIEYGINTASIKSADVKYASGKLNDQLMSEYLNGKIVLRYTTLDEDAVEGISS